MSVEAVGLSAWCTSPARPRLPTSFPLLPISLFGLCRLMGFSPVFICCGSVTKETTICKGEPLLASRGEKLMQITQRLRIAPSPELRSREAFAPAHARWPGRLQSKGPPEYHFKWNQCICGVRKSQSVLSTSWKFTSSRKCNLIKLEILCLPAPVTYEVLSIRSNGSSKAGSSLG